MNVPILFAAAGLGLCATVCQAGQPGGAGRPVGLANPASTNCAQKGGRTEIRSGDGGQVGSCRFPDGRVCEEWVLLRDGRCVPPG
ncbi:putative hemolysin [Methylobacterium oryzihabitans]|uniref:DUF333 domain-containing protein n=1 Tax=Methylobacterium oryzihabitans TaxID=2499852 RepID=A0A3S2VBU9_9HYPH|nr:DUF333 domain-containing protein [Methylobacterium oryzihabitans]RVU19084.1 DUF333 domain-containing protein [Methylobacterium oryzihabitans]